MNRRPVGKSGFRASRVAFGAWAIGGWKWGGTDAEQSIEAIRAALDAGVDFIDTAAIYGFGLSESLVGEALSNRRRDQVRIATKCGLRWDRESPTLHAESEGRRIFRTLEPDSIRWELEQSLGRLQTDYVDLYLTHWPDPATPLDAVIETLETLKNSGRVRAWGFCNCDPESLQRAVEIASPSADQERYSLLDREQDSANLPLCREADLAFLAYSPIAQGLLTGRLDGRRRFAETDLRHGNPRFSPAVLDGVQALLAPLKSLARESDVSVEQLILAWTLQQPGVSHVLVGARTAEQATSNAEAGSLELGDEELDLVQSVADAWPGFESFSG